jgi:2-desacetyl-2-hydroxyethyl bacteriochlorophyllide A dehydrogenase
MRAVRCEGRDVRVVELPPTAGPGVRVRVKAAGVCGSDLHLLGQVQGITLGHEIAGVTDDGTPVAVEPMSPCGVCGPCRAGDCNLCVEGVRMFHGVGLDGGMADEMRVPARALVPLPSGLPLRDASLVEPLAVVVYALRRAGLRASQRVVVIGGGTIGLCAVAAARAAGAEVALVARHDAQRAAGERLGATQASGQYDLVIEAAGSESALAQAIELAKPGGTVSIPGIYWTPIQLAGLPMCLREVTLQPAMLYSRGAVGRDVDVAAATLCATPELPRAVITHRFPLDAAAEAFATAASRSSGAIKVVLEP